MKTKRDPVAEEIAALAKDREGDRLFSAMVDAVRAWVSFERPDVERIEIVDDDDCGGGTIIASFNVDAGNPFAKGDARAIIGKGVSP